MLQRPEKLLKTKPLLLFFVLSFPFSTMAESERPPGKTILDCAQDNDRSTSHIAPPVFEKEKQNNTNISAETTRTDKQGSTELEGNVVIEKHGLRITSDNASYNQDSNDLNISGKVHVDTKTMSFDADAGTLSNDKKSTAFKEVQFYVQENGMRGKASSITTPPTLIIAPSRLLACITDKA